MGKKVNCQLIYEHSFAHQYDWIEQSSGNCDLLCIFVGQLGAVVTSMKLKVQFS